MKKRVLIRVIILIIGSLFAFGSAGFAQTPQAKSKLPKIEKTGKDPVKPLHDNRPDITFRPILYVTGGKAYTSPTIDVAHNLSVVEGGTITLPHDKAFEVSEGYLRANFGIMAVRQGGDLKRPLKVRFEIHSDGNLGESIGPFFLTFAAGKQVAEYDFDITMGSGPHKVTFYADSENEIAESNEKNNQFAVTLNVVLP